MWGHSNLELMLKCCSGEQNERFKCDCTGKCPTSGLAPSDIIQTQTSQSRLMSPCHSVLPRTSGINEAPLCPFALQRSLRASEQPQITLKCCGKTRKLREISQCQTHLGAITALSRENIKKKPDQ